jgi:hypothetical protein
LLAKTDKKLRSLLTKLLTDFVYDFVNRTFVCFLFVDNFLEGSFFVNNFFDNAAL